MHRLPRHRQIKVFEGFAGYGGASFGLRRAGIRHKVVGYSEVDEDAIELYHYNFPNIRNLGDITQLDPHSRTFPDFDLFTGGFPCQPFSTVGKRQGQEDERGRGTLFGDIIRICEVKQPQYILLENVKDNLFVIGTVNMDDTTHQFSRKVIDRAFTIEMNGGKMSEMFSPESKMLLEYRDEPIPLEAFKAEFVRAYEVLDDTRFAKYKDVISTHIPALLGDSDGTAEADSINGILNETPFRVSYRVQNELVLYLSTLIERANFPELDQIEGLIGEATLAILLEKVLPRVQGEQKQLETQNGKSNVLKDLKTFVESHFKPEEDTDANSLYNQVLRKLKEMDDKLANYYTNFF